MHFGISYLEFVYLGIEVFRNFGILAFRHLVILVFWNLEFVDLSISVLLHSRTPNDRPNGKPSDTPNGRLSDMRNDTHHGTPCARSKHCGKRLSARTPNSS